MKKILLLLVMAIFSMGASAQQKVGLLSKIADFTPVKMERTAPKVKVARKTTPNYAGQTYNVVADKYSSTYYDSDGDWYCVLQTEDEKVFFFDIYAETLEQGKKYTLADMDPYYTGNDKESATAAEFTYTVDGEEKTHVVAMMVVGGDTYNITYDEQDEIQPIWGEWEDFKPLGEATGTYHANVMFNSPIAQTALPVQVRYASNIDNLAEVKVSNWFKGISAGGDVSEGVDFKFLWDTKKNTCVVPEQETGVVYPSYGMIMIQDVATYAPSTYTAFPCTYDPATSTFSLCVVYYVSAGTLGYSKDTKGHTAETLVMDLPEHEETGDTIRHTIIKNAKWTDRAASQGWFQLNQYDNEYSASISTANSPLNQGEFWTEDLDVDYTYVGINGTKLTPTKLHAKVEIDADNVVKGILWLTDRASGDVYEVIMTHDPAKPIPLDYDDEDDIEVAFDYADIVQNTATGSSKRTINFVVKNDEYQLALTLYASSKDADIVIPEGEYTFATTKVAGTALISTGVSSTGSVNRSFLGSIVEGGLDRLWLLTAGKVIVTKVEVDGVKYPQVVVEGTNSYGASVKVTVGADPTGINILQQNETEKSSKMMKNGHIIISKDGLNYRMDGVQIL